MLCGQEFRRDPAFVGRRRSFWNDFFGGLQSPGYFVCEHVGDDALRLEIKVSLLGWEHHEDMGASTDPAERNRVLGLLDAEFLREDAVQGLVDRPQVKAG